MPETAAMQFAGFAGGVNIRDAPNQLAPDEAIAINNMILDERGAASKRRGTAKLADLPGRAISIYTFYRQIGNPQVLVQTSDGQLRFTEDEGETWAVIVSGISTTEPYCFKTFNNKVYMSNGVNDYATWDGATYTPFPTAPKGRFLTVWKDTMWVSGVPTIKDRVYSSAPGNAESFVATAWVDIGKGDGDEVTALDTDENFLIVFKRRRIATIYEAATFANRWSDTEKGCEGHFSVIHSNEQIFFLSRQGICVFLSDAPSRVISGRIAPFFRSEIININLLHKTWAFPYGDRVSWAFIEAGHNQHSIVVEFYPTFEKGPFTFHRFDCACATVVRRATTERCFFGKSTQNKFMELGVGGVDDDLIYVGAVETGWFDMDDPILPKYQRHMWVIGRGRFFVSIRRDFEIGARRTQFLDYGAGRDRWGPDAVDVWGGQGMTEIWGPEALYGIETFHPDVYGRYYSIRFSDGDESDVGSRAIDVGDVDHIITSGQWAVYGGSILAIKMGVSMR
jgi:hypothetical protein